MSRIRKFFAARGVLEIDTPALSQTGVPDPAIECIRADVAGLGELAHFLQPSPEYAMKRLLVAGSGDIYQLCRVFRDGELGRWHQPEFTLLEWYRVGWDESELMTEVEQLFNETLGNARPSGPSVRLTYAQAFERHLNIDPHDPGDALPSKLRERGIHVPQDLSSDALLDLALSQIVVPGVDSDALTFVYDYPASQASLAEIKPTTPRVAARFEVFARGIELANGFRELRDPNEQRRRFEAELAMRTVESRTTPPLDEEFLAALEQGLPACAGVAVGVDRLVALAAGLDNVADAMSFAHQLP